MSDKFLGRIVVARYGGGTGELKAVGRCIGYQERPTVIIEDANGKITNWCADLCEPLELADDVVKALVPLLPIREIEGEK